MPPQAPVAQVVAIGLGGTIGTGKWHNGFYLQYTGTAPQVADLASVMAAVQAAWTTNIAPLAATTTALTTLTAADLTNTTASYNSISITPVPGTRTGTANPSNSALVSSWQINHRYRGGHPRTYWPIGVTTDVSSGSQWSATFRPLALSSIQAFRTALNAITTGATSYKMVSVSRRQGGVLIPTPTPFSINGVVVHGRVDTQRLRLGKETP